MSGTGEPYGEERERPGPRFGRTHEEEEEGEGVHGKKKEAEMEEEEEEEKMKAQKQTCPGDAAQGGTCVAMETASSGNGWFSKRQKMCGKKSGHELSLTLIKPDSERLLGVLTS